MSIRRRYPETPLVGAAAAVFDKNGRRAAACSTAAPHA